MQDVCIREICPVRNGPLELEFVRAIQAERIFKNLYLILLVMQISVIIAIVSLLVSAVAFPAGGGKEQSSWWLGDLRNLSAVGVTIVALILRRALGFVVSGYKDSVVARKQAGKDAMDWCEKSSNSPCKPR
jgi:hypothetical protein